MRTRQFLFLAAALCASALFTGCSNELAESVTPAAEPQDGYPISIKATKADAGDITRALTLNNQGQANESLTASWAATDRVYVYKLATDGTETYVATLAPSTSGSATTDLVGVISGTNYTTNDKLTLYYLKPKTSGDGGYTGKVFGDYTGQVATIADIAENYDFSKTTLGITMVGGASSGPILDYEDATGTKAFQRQQSITKFKLILGTTGTPLSYTEQAAMVTSLNISASGLEGDTGSGLDITPALPTDKYFIALRNTTGAQAYTFKATLSNGMLFKKTFSSINLPVNKYLGGEVHLTRNISDTDVTNDITITESNVTAGNTLDGTNITVTDMGNPMVQDQDYTVSYEVSGQSGTPVTTAVANTTYVATITGIGMYEGTKMSGTFNATSLPTATISLMTGTDYIVDNQLLVQGSSTMKVGATAEYTPTGGGSATPITTGITYSSSNTSGLSIANDGTITATTPGTYTITIAVAGDGSNYNGATMTITVYVQKSGIGGSVADPDSGSGGW